MSHNSLIKDSLNLSIARFVTLVISILANMLLARFRTLEEYGTYSQILTSVSLLVVFITLGLPNCVNYFLPRVENLQEESEFISTYYIINTVLSLLGGLLLAFMLPFLVRYFNNDLLSNYLFIIILLPWTKVITGSLDSVLVVKQKTKLLFKFRIFHSLSILIAIIGIKFLYLGFYEYMVAFICVETVFAILVYIIVYKKVVFIKLSVNSILIKKIFQFSVPLGLATLAGTFSLEIDKLMIGRFLGTETLAIYANAGRELPVTIFSAALVAVAMPKIVRSIHEGEVEKAVMLWGNTAILSYIIVAFFVSIFLVFAPQIITILYSEKYLPGVPIFRIYSLVLLLRATYFGIILNSTGNTKFILYSSIISLLLNILLNYTFFIIFGFIGPALATFTCIIIMNLAQLVYTSKIINIKFLELLPWKKVFKILIINLIFGVMFYYLQKMTIKKFYINELLSAIILGIIWAGLYLIVTKNKIYQLMRKI
jgi:O-antigen/teichoic acid export membrane protein